MARIIIEFPHDKIIFETTIMVQVSDINYGNHLSNDAVLRLCQEVRMRFLKQWDYTELNIENLGIIMADAALIFKGEGYHGNQLTISMAIDDISRVSFDLYYYIKHGEREIAIVKTAIVFFDYKLKKVSTCPASFLSKLKF
jgi:acyl-CoA thioesterase FadM